MKVFITGATGFIGGSVAAALVDKGYEVSGLVRTKEKAEQLQALGITPVLGELDDSEILTASAADADIIINAASSDHRGSVDAILKALVGTGKTFVQTSGSSVTADDARGEPSDIIFDEATLIDPIPERIARADLNKIITSAATDGIRSMIVCPSMIYGRGRGLHERSSQIPALIADAKKHGVARYVGQGLNRWSNVHIDDVVALFLLAIEHGKPSDFFFAENGEATLKSIAEEAGRLLGFSPVAKSITFEEAENEWGRGLTVAIASNSRVRGVKSRELGWQPKTDDLIASIAEEI